jgi:hypothetical protein
MHTYGKKPFHNPWINTDDYEADIVRYYTNDARELDALLFENSCVKTAETEQCIDWILHDKFKATKMEQVFQLWRRQ